VKIHSETKGAITAAHPRAFQSKKRLRRYPSLSDPLSRLPHPSTGAAGGGKKMMLIPLLLSALASRGIARRCVFRGPVGGTELQQRVGEFPAEPGVPVDTAWDIGIGDYTSIWCFQRGPDRIRLVHYIQDCGEGLPYYLNELSRLRALHGWSLAEHYWPP
jgi:hypothetical protein